MNEADNGVSWVELGVVARPHGVGGELRVHVYNPESTLLEELGEVFVLGEPDEDPTLIEVESTRRGPKTLLMRLRGVASREDAEALRGLVLAVPRQALPELEDGEYYHTDLIGMDAVVGPRKIGTVVEVLDYPSVDCLRIKAADGFFEVPMLPRWLDRVDVEGGRVHLHELEDVPLQKGR
ncbi:MAG: ribosome maturation factor RimM [Myxococcota bacterium]